DLGSHNLRSIAYAVAYARARGLPPGAVEHQLLYGMAEPIHAALCRLGFRVRVYAPVGDLVAGMAYLVRRLLENTSNESFIRHRFAEGQTLEALVAPPAAAHLPEPADAAERPATDPAAPGPFANEPHAELRRAHVRARLEASVTAAPAPLGFEAGKPLAGAVADVCEASDFGECYGREAPRLGAGAPVLWLPGETNVYRYQPRGVGVVIAPWNFPLAIPAGMATAALVTGNCVV